MIEGLSYALLAAFFVVAALYSSVGHGGASGYLAVLTLFGLASPKMVPIVLVLNVLVASISFVSFKRDGHFRPELLLPFVVTSIPAAFVGGAIHVDGHRLRLLLGVCLLLVAIRVLLLRPAQRGSVLPGARARWAVGAVLGIILGLVSGMLGIGGGVFLSPLLLLLGWANNKECAGVSSAFIVLNSVSGVIGHATRGNIHLTPAIPLVVVVVLGAVAGSFAGARRIPERGLGYVLGVLLLGAASKLLLTS